MSPNRLGLIAALALIPFFSGCSSAPTNTEYKPDRVVGRMDELDSRPNWVTESTSVQEKDGKLQFIGVSEVPGDSRVQAAFKMSDARPRGYGVNKTETSATTGIETPEQLAFLRRHRCDVGQGYLFDKPIPGSELIEKLQRYPRGPTA